MAASLPDTEGVMALESSFQIFVRKTGEAPQEVHVTPTTTVAEIKAQKEGPFGAGAEGPFLKATCVASKATGEMPTP